VGIERRALPSPIWLPTSAYPIVRSTSNTVGSQETKKEEIEPKRNLSQDGTVGAEHLRFQALWYTDSSFCIIKLANRHLSKQVAWELAVWRNEALHETKYVD
ncbi:unnamed protein product, partial [Musa acuminata subsp. burmannicoides]